METISTPIDSDLQKWLDHFDKATTSFPENGVALQKLIETLITLTNSLRLAHHSLAKPKMKKCHRCRKLGHIARDCVAPPPLGLCTKCDGKHWRFDCPYHPRRGKKNLRCSTKEDEPSNEDPVGYFKGRPMWIDKPKKCSLYRINDDIVELTDSSSSEEDWWILELGILPCTPVVRRQTVWLCCVIDFPCKIHCFIHQTCEENA